MMTLDNLQISSELFWMSAVITATLDVILISILIWRIKPSQFRDLKWILVGTAVLSWSAFAILLVSAFWDAYYHHFFPSWFRSGGILLFVPILFGSLAFAFHWLALRVLGNPIVTFCLLGGMESFVEHLWGIYSFKILEIPFLQEASPASILAFAFPEYIFYWCIVISIATLVQSGWRWFTKQRRTRLRTHSVE
jgi:hypothetical protein